jgi:hypothetical protein
MPTYEVSRTLVKSPPELWDELQTDRLPAVIEGATVHPHEDQRSLEWEADGARGTAVLEPAGWGTKLTLTAEVEDQVAEHGVWARLRGLPPPEPRHPDMERTLEALLDDLGSAHKKPFTRA